MRRAGAIHVVGIPSDVIKLVRHGTPRRTHTHIACLLCASKPLVVNKSFGVIFAALLIKKSLNWDL